jgi:hypothetical protein
MRQARQNVRDFDDEQAETFISAITTPCPKCKVPIEKEGGCDHMTCAQCSYEFCFRCSASYAKILKHDNRRHKRSCVYYAGVEIMPAKIDVEPSPEPSTKPRATRKRTVKNKPALLTKVKAAGVVVKNKPAGITKKKTGVASRVVRRGTRTGLRSETAAALAAAVTGPVTGPVTRSQTARR